MNLTYSLVNFNKILYLVYFLVL